MAKHGNHSSLLFHLGTICFILPFSIFVILCLISITILYIYRLFHRGLAKFIRPDLKGILPPLSHIFTHDGWEDLPTYNVCIALIFEGDLKPEDLIQQFQEKVISSRKANNGDLEYPELRRYWVRFGSYFFYKEEENFDLKDHIRVYDYKRHGGGDSVSEGELCDMFSKLLEEPWRHEQSPWEWLVIPNYRISSDVESPMRRTATIFRINHALGEGYSVHNLLVKVASSKINPMLERQEIKKRSRSVEILRGILDTYQLTSEFLRFLLGLRLDDYAWMVQSNEPGDKYSTVRTAGIPVDSVKEIRKKFGVRFISVVMSAVLNAFEKMAHDAGTVCPKAMNFVNPIPMPNHPGGLRNNISGRLIRLPFGAKDSVSRLKSVQNALTSNGEVLHNLTFALFKFSGMLPTKIVTMSPPSGYTVDCTTIPGPHESCSIGGCKLEHVYASFGSGPGGVDGEGMCAATAVSCRGNLTITLVTTTRRGPASVAIIRKQFDHYVQEEIQELLNATETSVDSTDAPLIVHC